tara:strand:+ start:355 stop:777 length:423 start_codon:yes stop_codon:yes gene_type:complete
MTEFNSKERTLARENILKILYQHELNHYSFSEIIKTFVEKRNFDREYFENIIQLYELNINQINSFIEKNSDISLITIPSIDISILRLAVCELQYRDDVPEKVVLNESINIAKKYSSTDSYKFINKILDQLLVKIKKNDQK